MCIAHILHIIRYATRGGGHRRCGDVQFEPLPVTRHAAARAPAARRCRQLGDNVLLETSAKIGDCRGRDRPGVGGGQAHAPAWSAPGMAQIEGRHGAEWDSRLEQLVYTTDPDAAHRAQRPGGRLGISQEAHSAVDRADVGGGFAGRDCLPGPGSCAFSWLARQARMRGCAGPRIGASIWSPPPNAREHHYELRLRRQGRQAAGARAEASVDAGA